MKTMNLIEYLPYNENLPDLFPLKSKCSDTTYISKMTDFVFDILEDTLFKSTNCFIPNDKKLKVILSSINPRKKRQAKQTLYYTLSYIRMAEYNDYKMNLAISLNPNFYTKSTFSRTYFLPIIREMIMYELLEIGKVGSKSKKTVTVLKSTKKLIDIFNKFGKSINTEIHFVIEDDLEYIEIRKDKNCNINTLEDTSIENWAKENKITVFDRNVTLTIKNYNSLYSKLIKNDKFIFSYNYHEKFLKDTHNYFKSCIFGYNRNLEIDYNKELKIKYEYVKNNTKNFITKKELLNTMIPKISINRFRIKPCRIFNNSSLTHGGRIYHMFLEEIPSVIRKTVTIDNNKTSCIDFTAMHPSLLHYFIFDQFPKTSIYKIIKPLDTDKFKIDNSTLEIIIKMATVISLNSTNEKAAINALKFKIKKSIILNTSNNNFKYQKNIIPIKYNSFICSKPFLIMIFKKIYNELNWLYNLFFTGIGMELFFIESLVYIKTAKIHFEKSKEFPISIHDGYVVKSGNIDILIDSINESCKLLFGKTIPYKIEY